WHLLDGVRGEQCAGEDRCPRPLHRGGGDVPRREPARPCQPLCRSLEGRQFSGAVVRDCHRYGRHAGARLRKYAPRGDRPGGGSWRGRRFGYAADDTLRLASILAVADRRYDCPGDERGNEMNRTLTDTLMQE